MAQQKQRKQLHLTDDNNIFTDCFQSIQRLQPNSKTFMPYEISCIPSTREKTQNQGHSYHNDNVYNPILSIIHSKQQIKQTQPKQPKQLHQRGFY